MSNYEKCHYFFFFVGFITLGLGIYGLSGSLLAAICLPIAAIALLAWYQNKPSNKI